MAITINKEAKTISIDGEINFTELEKLKEFIGVEYDQYKISATPTIVEKNNWYPVYPYYPQPYYPQPYYYSTPYNSPLVTHGDGTTTIDCQSPEFTTTPTPTILGSTTTTATLDGVMRFGGQPSYTETNCCAGGHFNSIIYFTSKLGTENSLLAN